MSIVESALNKVRRQAETQPKPANTSSRADTAIRRADTSAATAAPSVKPRKFPEVALDPQSMERHCVLPQVTDQSAQRAYKILRTRMLQKMTANNWYSVGVTGSTPGEGKTLTAINLAIAMAQDVNTWVFLVDLDLQRPQIGNYLGIEFNHGLGDYLVGEADLNDILYTPSGFERLALIPNARSFSNSSELLASPRMGDLASLLAAEQPRRIVIYDMPPLLASDDALAFAPRVDGLLLVLAEGISARSSLDKAKQLIGENNLIGVVLNQSAESNESPYY